MVQRMRLGRIGVWNSGFTNAQRGGGPDRTAEIADAAAELEALDYGTIWLGGSPSVEYCEPLLQATARLKVATGILSIWEHEAVDVAAARADLEQRYPGRFVLGLGVSHEHFSGRYERPYAAMRDFLSSLDSADTPVPVDARVLAALGPRMLALSRDRAAGAHPYLVTVEHTAQAREILGAEAVLAPEFKVVLDPNRDTAVQTARAYLQSYLAMRNYTNSFLRLGFTEEDFTDGGSDRLIDAVFALGDAEHIAERVAGFLAAGADHVAIQVVNSDPHHVLPRAEWRQLAEVLPLGG